MVSRTKLMVAIVALCVLSFAAGVCINEALASGTKIIGKAKVKKGSVLMGLVMTPRGLLPIVVEAFEDQEIYIFDKIPATEGNRGGYSADGEGFVHNCPEHGREVMSGAPIMIVIPLEQTEKADSGVTVLLFENS